MNNPFRHKVAILDRSEDHFSGKKKPWESRVAYPPALAATYFVQITVFLLLLWFLPDWRTLLILFAALSMWGLAEATKSKYYRIGYFDGMQDSGVDASKRESEE